MNRIKRRSSLVEDCLLAGFVSVIAYIIILPFAKMFVWPALLALLIVPTALLSTYRRYRSAGMCATFGLIAGAWDVVPPAQSFVMDDTGIVAVATFAFAATMTIAVAAWVAKRRIATQTSR